MTNQKRNKKKKRKRKMMIKKKKKKKKKICGTNGNPPARGKSSADVPAKCGPAGVPRGRPTPPSTHTKKKNNQKKRKENAWNDRYRVGDRFAPVIDDRRPFFSILFFIFYFLFFGVFFWGLFLSFLRFVLVFGCRTPGRRMKFKKKKEMKIRKKKKLGTPPTTE